MTTTAADLWHHYGRERAATDRSVPETFSWAWSQDGGPGAEALGDLTGLCVGDLGAGSARQAAHLVAHHQPARVVAVDASAARHAMATGLYSGLAPRLHLVHADAVEHLRTMRGSYDVLYSVFGAVDFTDPRDLLPAAGAALRPGGRLVFSTLAHYLNGEPAESEVVHADIAAKTPDGTPATVRRWVLREHLWVNLLDAAGLSHTTVDVLPAPEGGQRTADTLLVTASRK
ncbi:class I SAM-dependent methyltransferase [Streptomyces sp. SID10853]|uniref:methyltransferase domain-containing protein n=1 Tax=Streptomyces sp. SID10853 TaxID=2706028 RepID=UPI0013BFE39F|nr:class I SAM-dependent methyltransferase [Streptomyces sp. SID10853]